MQFSTIRVRDNSIRSIINMYSWQSFGLLGNSASRKKEIPYGSAQLFQDKISKTSWKKYLKKHRPMRRVWGYHSIVTELKSLGKNLKSTSMVKGEGTCTTYLLLLDPQIIKTDDKW